MAFVNAHLNWGDYAQTEEQVREVEAAATELVEKYPGATVPCFARRALKAFVVHVRQRVLESQSAHDPRIGLSLNPKP